MKAAGAALLCLAALTACGRTTPLQPRDPVPPPDQVPPGKCQLIFTPGALDFGDVDGGAPVIRAVTLQNFGGADCLVNVALSPDSDPGYALRKIDPNAQLTLHPGETQLARVEFQLEKLALPEDRAGKLELTTNDPQQPNVEVPLDARLHICALTAAPDPLNFGNVALNTTSQAKLTLTNTGHGTCHVTDIALDPTTDPLFTLVADPSSVELAPAASVKLGVSFSATESAPPHLRTGAIVFDVDDPAHGAWNVPLSAYVNTICTEIGQYIYTVDSNYTFARFDPNTLTSTDIATLQCPVVTPGATPFSMNLDQKGTAWVLYSDGNIYTVDPTTAACTPTKYVPGQQGFSTFGMGSVFDADAGADTLYIATADTTGGELGTLNLNSLLVSSVGPVGVGSVELAGTGDGELWAFAPSDASVTGNAELAQLDPATGATLEQYDLLPLNQPAGQGTGWAVKFYGGNFYIFLGPDVWQVERGALLPGNTAPTTPPVKVLSTPGRDIVGAGVSTCAPVQ